MDEHPVIRFTNELMMVSELDQRAAGAFVRSVFQEGAHEGEQRVVVELHRARPQDRGAGGRTGAAPWRGRRSPRLTGGVRWALRRGDAARRTCPGSGGASSGWPLSCRSWRGSGP
ncbi:hypothetical protein [Streptomyces thioluteus]|uniref:hypothetical protein n=1 Tax=Streptomyces thioluteus TaxID=66431 RepID=UPI0031EDA12A